MFNTVEEFKDAWLRAGCPIRPPFNGAVYTTDVAYSTVLFRDGQFQVELYTCKPNTQSPPHKHPGVDSFFIFLGGNIEFGREDGTFTDLSSFQKSRPDGAHMLFGVCASALNGAPHALRVGPEGGAFLSFEKWNDQDPTSVLINWDGDAISEEHDEMLAAEKSMKTVGDMSLKMACEVLKQGMVDINPIQMGALYQVVALQKLIAHVECSEGFAS